MGFFSSIGKVFSSVAKPVLGVVGGILGNNQAQSNYDQQMGFAREQFEYQKMLHQNQLQWRVEDAKKAGLHPMAALGLSSMQFSPVSGPSSASADYSWIGDLGQNLDYAATKGKTNVQQAQAFALAQKSGEVQIEGQELDNEFKRLQIMSLVSRLTQTGPAAPEVNTNNPINEPDSPFTDKPIVRDGWLLDEKGRKISVIPSEAMKGRTEDVLGVEWFPFISSAYRDARGRMLGHEINGHWWHGLDKGYLPYPPKASPRSSRVKVSDYYSRSYRY